MSSKYARKRKHDLDQDTSEETASDVSRKKPDKPSPKKSRQSKKDDDSEAISIDETNKIRAQLGLAPLEVDEAPTGDASAANGHPDGELFTEHGIEIVHKAPKNLTADKEAEKLREKLEIQKKKRQVYGKVLKANKGLAESDSEDEGVDNFLEKMRQAAQKKAQMFDSMDQEAEQDADSQQKKLQQQQRKLKEARQRKKDDALTAGLVVGHSKEAFVDGTETILVLADKNVLDEDAEEVLVNPNLLDDERHKRNVERRKQKSDYRPYDEEELDEHGMVKKQGILAKYDDELGGEKKRETFRLDQAGGYDLDREQQEMEMKRRLMMANKKFETLEMPKYTPAREFFTEEEMLTFRKPKKNKKDKLRKTKALKAADIEAEGETAEEKLAKAKRLAARRGEPMETEAPSEPNKNGSTKKSSKQHEMEEGEVDDSTDIKPVGRSKWKEATGASVDLSRIRSLAAKVGADEKEQEEESDEDEDLVQGVSLGGVFVDDEAEDELHGALERSRKLQQIAIEQRDEGKRVREMLSQYGAIKQEPDAQSDHEEQMMGEEQPSEGIIIDATSEQYKMIGEIPTFGLAGNRNDYVDYSELLEEHKRIAEQQIKEQQKDAHPYSDESDNESLSEINTNQIKRRGNDSDMELDEADEDADEQKPMWKPVGDEEPRPSSSKKPDNKRNYRRDRSKQDDDSDIYGTDYKNVLGEEKDVTKGVGAMLRLAAEKGYLENKNKGASGGALGHLESKRYSRVEQGRMDIEDKYLRKLERMGTTGSGPTRSFDDKREYNPNVEITYTDEHGRPLDRKEAFRALSWKFHGKKPGKKQLEKRMAQVQKRERLKKMNSMDTPLGTLQKQRKKQEQTQAPYLLLSGSNRDDVGAPLQKD